MSYYPDLSSRFREPKTLNVGWLDGEYPFATARPAKWMVQKLWSFCECSLLYAGGFHQCNLTDCAGPARKLIRSDALTERELQERQASLRSEIRTGILSGISKARKADILADLNSSLKSVLRGYSNMVLGVHPDSGERIELGYAEIRVFGEKGKIYAAPNMLYHYVTVHHYKPPDEFVQALKHGLCPPDPEYLARLNAIGFPCLTRKVIKRFGGRKN